MSDFNFSSGDIVVLKSGGPPMTVETVENDWVEVVWFINNDLKRGSFSSATLRKSEPPKPTTLG